MKSFAKTVNPDATRVSAKQLQKEVKTMTTASTKPFYADLEHSTIIIFSEKQMTDPLTLHQYDITRLFPAMVEHFTLKGVRDNLSGNNLMIMKEIKYTCRDQLKDYIHHVLESFELFQAASDVRKAHKDCALAKRACELSPAVSTVWACKDLSLLSCKLDRKRIVILHGIKVAKQIDAKFKTYDPEMPMWMKCRELVLAGDFRKGAQTVDQSGANPNKVDSEDSN